MLYYFTGGHDKRGCLWDLRQPHTPVEQFEKSKLLLFHYSIIQYDVIVVLFYSRLVD